MLIYICELSLVLNSTKMCVEILSNRSERLMENTLGCIVLSKERGRR